MRARRTENTDVLHTLRGGNEDNYLWSYYLEDEQGRPIVTTVWVPTDEERQRIADGENIQLLVWGEKTPPVAMRLTDEKIGKPPNNPTSDMEGGST